MSFARSQGQTLAYSDIARLVADGKYEVALHLSDENYEKPLRLMRAGNLYLELHQLLWDENVDLDRAIAAYKTAISVTPDGHQCQAELHSKLEIALLYSAEYSGDIEDINNAIAALECGLTLTPDDHADKPGRLNNLGVSFARRFELSGDLVDIGQAIAAHERAVHLLLMARLTCPVV